MPVPQEYQQASDQFFSFLVDARNNADLGSTHQAYTMVQGVLQAFRRRLTTQEAIRFAATLPPLTKALFISDWDLDESRPTFGDVDAMTREVQSLRSGHNFSPDTAIRDVSRALHNYVDTEAFDRVLNELPKGAADFWKL